MHEPERAAPAWLTAGDTTDEVVGLLKTGKEAEVFVVERRAPDGRAALLAHKRYRPMELSKGVLEAGGFSKARTFTADAAYQAGRGFGSSPATGGRWPGAHATAGASWPTAGPATSTTRSCTPTRPV